MKYVPKEQKENHNITRKHPLKEALILTTSIVGLLFLVYLASGFISDLMAPYIPISVEKRLGVTIENHLPFQPDLQKSRDLQKILDFMVKESQLELRFPLKVEVVNDDTVNAIALPGGRIIFFEGLLNKLEGEEEIAFILAHEIGHFHNFDHLKALGRSLIMYFITSTLSIGEGTIPLLDVSKFMELERSRSQELEADLFALRVLYKSYGRKDGAVNFFKKLVKLTNTPEFVKYFMTHPHPEERLKRVIQYQVLKSTSHY